jgi:hypothetical protein
MALNPFEKMLRATLENAVRAPYYKRAFGNRWRKVRTLDDLARLPLLDKPTAIRVQKDLIVGTPPPGAGVISTGTTRLDQDTPPLNVLHSREELRAIAGVSPEVAPRAVDPEQEPEPIADWTLAVVSVTHGLPEYPRPHGELRLPWMVDRNSLHMLESVLSRPQPDGGRVTAMRISTAALKVFTAWLLERGRDPSTFGVRLIGTNGFRVSPHWVRLIERAYGAKLFDNYSLSEFYTPATQCEHCEWLHFGWPPILYEVLDLVTGKRLEKGVGQLVLTGLYPFVQKMPLIRYQTGDVVELGTRCKQTGARRVRVLGRVRRGLVWDQGGSGAFLLAPTDVQDVLESLPESERSVHPCTTLGYVKSRDLGLPRWTTQLIPGSPPEARLEFEVRFDPVIFPDRARALEAQVGKELQQLAPALRSEVKQGSIALRVRAAPAQSLTPPSDKYA